VTQDQGPGWVAFAIKGGGLCLVAAITWRDGHIRTALPIAALQGRPIRNLRGVLVLRDGERLAIGRDLRAMALADGWLGLAPVAAPLRPGDCRGGRIELRARARRRRTVQ